MEKTDSLQDREEEALDSRGLAQVLPFCQTRGCGRASHPGCVSWTPWPSHTQSEPLRGSYGPPGERQLGWHKGTTAETGSSEALSPIHPCGSLQSLEAKQPTSAPHAGVHLGWTKQFSAPGPSWKLWATARQRLFPWQAVHHDSLGGVYETVMVDRFNPEKVGSGETLGREWRRKEGWVPPLPETSGWGTLLPAHRDPVPSSAVTC